MPFISTSHKHVILEFFTLCAVCTRRRINQVPYCAIASGSQNAATVWLHFGIGASVRYYAFTCCELTQYVLPSSLYMLRKCTECVIYSS